MDIRLSTFLEVLATGNYTRAAENLHITQPAVTKHMRSLEEEFGAVFFRYNGKKMVPTEEARVLENYARSQQKNYRDTLDHFKKEKARTIRIGLTKTLGEYAYAQKLAALVKDRPNDFVLTVDNTEALLERLRNARLDFLMVEGQFAKNEFDFDVLKEETFTGICSVDHPYKNRTLAMEEVTGGCLVVRESGSGSREILEDKLRYKGYEVRDFKRLVTTSSLALISQLVAANVGISFGYESIAKNNPRLATFHVEGITDRHEFTLVALKGTGGIELYRRLTDGAKEL